MSRSFLAAFAQAAYEPDQNSAALFHLNRTEVGDLGGKNRSISETRAVGQLVVSETQGCMRQGIDGPPS
jgi:hypothetical protein